MKSLTETVELLACSGVSVFISVCCCASVHVVRQDVRSILYEQGEVNLSLLPAVVSEPPHPHLHSYSSCPSSSRSSSSQDGVFHSKTLRVTFSSTSQSFTWNWALLEKGVEPHLVALESEEWEWNRIIKCFCFKRVCHVLWAYTVLLQIAWVLRFWVSLTDLRDNIRFFSVTNGDRTIWMGPVLRETVAVLTRLCYSGLNRLQSQCSLTNQ